MKKVFCILILFLSGCLTTDSSDKLSTINYNATGTARGLYNTSTDIKNSTGIVNNTSNSIKSIPNVDNHIVTYVDTIIDENQKIKKAANGLVEVADGLVKLQVDINEHNKMIGIIAKLKKDNGSLIDENNRLLNSAKAQHQKIWIAVISLCSIGLVAGIGLLWVNKELGVAVAVSSLATTCIAYFFASHAVAVGWIGGIIFVLALIYLGYKLFKSERNGRVITDSLSKYKQATCDIMQSVETIKEHNRDVWNVSANQINRLQTPETKQIIKEIKTNFINK
jgi:hypothetical protein